MDKEEFKLIVKGLKAVYTSDKFLPDVESMQMWLRLLGDLDYKTVSLATQKYMVSNKFPPTPAEIREMAAELTTTGYLDELEAWAIVNKALQDGYYHSKERFLEMPDIIQETVGSPENLRNWSGTDLDTIQAVVMPNFLKQYRIVKARRKEREQLPEQLRALTLGIANKLSPPELEDKQTERERLEGVTATQAPVDYKERLKAIWDISTI